MKTDSDTVGEYVLLAFTALVLVALFAGWFA
jgi:hypothetical protein